MKRIYLEITDACNLDCPFCTYEKRNRFMSYEKIADYLGQISPYCSYIYLHILGEPLLHPDFDRILDLLDELKMHLQLVTNGTLLDSYPGLLDHPCLRKLSISLHSIGGIDTSGDYFKTIDRLIETDRKTTVELRFYDPEHLDGKLKEYLKKLNEAYPFTATAKKNSFRIRENTYVYFEELFSWPKITDPEIGGSGTCRGALDMLGITVDSRVTLCCLDPLAYNAIGSLEESTFAQIIGSDKYKKHVQEFKAHKISSPLCRRCSYRLRFR